MKSSKFGVFKNGLEDTNLWYFFTGLGKVLSIQLLTHIGVWVKTKNLCSLFPTQI